MSLATSTCRQGLNHTIHWLLYKRQVDPASPPPLQKYRRSTSAKLSDTICKLFFLQPMRLGSVQSLLSNRSPALIWCPGGPLTRAVCLNTGTLNQPESEQATSVDATIHEDSKEPNPNNCATPQTSQSPRHNHPRIHPHQYSNYPESGTGTALLETDSRVYPLGRDRIQSIHTNKREGGWHGRRPMSEMNHHSVSYLSLL